ncbi:NAD-dependent epimerase/dehydratase family protein [Arthrobacter sp. H20]|uniref:NAD-dependent epimerase/dehydratase family protein n=1 Tax=Arthrobacter sp. H20 TaxID=1267981 RepID=UPI000478E4C9|nr:NAD-dependent epimerase/dehydratase family protein [Arthrobacter sp. H20]
MRVLVTGASGMLGRVTADLIRSRGHHVVTFQRRPSGLAGVEDSLGSITDQTAVLRAVQGVDAVVHLAAKVSFGGAAADFEAINVEGTRALLGASRSAGVHDFIFVSSPSVAHIGEALMGQAATPATPDLVRGNYAQTKAKAELLALQANSTSFRVAAIRPHIVWGPGDTQLVERVLERARAGRLPLLDAGTALVDTTYVGNAAEAIVAALGSMDRLAGQAVVVTNGEPRPIGELIAGICRAGGVEPPRWSVPGRVARIAGSIVERVWQRGGIEGEPPMTRFLAEQLSTAHWFDQRRTRELLDWTPTVSIDEGLARLAQHYRGQLSTPLPNPSRP